MAPTKKRKIEEEVHSWEFARLDNNLKSDYIKLKTDFEQLKREKQENEERLEERVLCPVCLEVPTAGPLYTCPNGHIICPACYQGPASSCPVCRTRMGRHTSLLGAAVIETIKHACRAEGCDVKSPLGEVEQHRAACSFRPVTCPAVRCNKKIAFCHVMDHILNACAKKTQKVLSINKSNTKVISLGVRWSNPPLERSDVNTLAWDDRFFFLTVKGRQSDTKSSNIYVQMLGTKEQCGEYKVTVSIKDQQDGHKAVTFCDKPYAIDMAEEVKDYAGMMVANQILEQCSRAWEGKPGVSKLEVTLEFEKV